MKKLKIGERACLGLAEFGKRPIQVLQVIVSITCLCWNALNIPRKGQTLLRRCPEVGTTAGNPAPSLTVAASPLMVEAKAVNGEWCFAAAMSSRKALNRGFECLDRLVVLMDNATRRNTSIVARRVISVIALTVG